MINESCLRSIIIFHYYSAWSRSPSCLFLKSICNLLQCWILHNLFPCWLSSPSTVNAGKYRKCNRSDFSCAALAFYIFWLNILCYGGSLSVSWGREARSVFVCLCCGGKWCVTPPAWYLDLAFHRRLFLVFIRKLIVKSNIKLFWISFWSIQLVHNFTSVLLIVIKWNRKKGENSELEQIVAVLY